MLTLVALCSLTSMYWLLCVRLVLCIKLDELLSKNSPWGDPDTTQSLAVTGQLQRLQLQQDRSEARYHRDRVQAQRSITAAAGIGGLLKSSSAWFDSNRWLKLHGVKKSTITELIEKLLRSLPHSWEECIQLDIKETAKGESGNRKRKKLELTSQSADGSATAAASQTHSAPLKESQVQLA